MEQIVSGISKMERKNPSSKDKKENRALHRIIGAVILIKPN
jgi:hypothetical protein